MVQAMDKAILTFPFGKYAPWFGAVIQGFPDSFNEWLLPGSSMIPESPLQSSNVHG